MAANTVSCTQLEIGYSIMASIVPCLKSFMAPYDRPLEGPSQYQQYGYGGGTSHKLSSVASATNSQNENIAGGIEGEDDEGVWKMGRKFMGKLRPEQTIYEARVVTSHENTTMDRTVGTVGK